MESIKLSVMYITFFLVRETFQNTTPGCHDGYYRNETSGTCIKCPPGYTGVNCSVLCVDGWYGQNCQHECPPSCSKCSVIDGSCSKECPPGYRGPNCSVLCVDGFYGENCQHQCPSTCSNCNSIDGSCPKDMTNTTDTGDINASNHIILRRNISAFYIVTTFGCATAVALLLVLMFYTYKLATQPLPQNFTFMVHDLESDAERNTMNPASGSIYQNV